MPVAGTLTTETETAAAVKPTVKIPQSKPSAANPVNKGKGAAETSAARGSQPGYMRDTAASQAKRVGQNSKIFSHHSMQKALDHSPKYKQFLNRVDQLKKQAIRKKVTTHYPRYKDISLNEFKKIESQAEKMFQTFRQATDDIKKISAHTGLPIEDLQLVKSHLFLDKHVLDSGVMRLHPDLDIAEAWQRLASGSFYQSDLILLCHEYSEALLASEFKVPLREIHNYVEKIHNWRSQIFEG